MHTVERDGEMFPAEVDRIVGQVSWDHREGWRIFLAHLHEGEAQWRCEPLELAQLDLAELLTALDTYATSVRGY